MNKHIFRFLDVRLMARVIRLSSVCNVVTYILGKDLHFSAIFCTA